MKRRLVVIPTYNEAESIEALLEAIFDTVYGCEVLVVDDGSPDKTAEICKRLKEKHQHLHIMERTEKSGLGSAYRAGFAWALNREFEEFIEMDADGVLGSALSQGERRAPREFTSGGDGQENGGHR